MKKPAPRKFTGPLAAPISVAPLPGPATRLLADLDMSSLLDQRAKQVSGRRLEKLLLLFKHYDIEVGQDDLSTYVLRLAMALADDFVPGFAVVEDVPKRRRPRTWTLERRIWLLFDFGNALNWLQLGGKPMPSDVEVLRFMITAPAFEARWGLPEGRDAELEAETLASRLSEARTDKEHFGWAPKFARAWLSSGNELDPPSRYPFPSQSSQAKVRRSLAR